jgi:predicted phage terminase large subunit-like protein
VVEEVRIRPVVAGDTRFGGSSTECCGDTEEGESLGQAWDMQRSEAPGSIGSAKWNEGESNTMNLADLIASLPEGERAGLLEMAQQYQDALVREKCQTNFLEFVKAMWPGFIHGRHHAVMAKKFEAIAEGKLKRLIINMPPRHTKSEFASYLLPAWFLGKYPNKKIIQSSNTAELAVGFGRKVRNLVDGETYAKIFPNVALRHDSKAAGRWSTNANGEYFAIGVGGTVTGKGADLLIIDDPHSEQEAALAANDPSIYDKVYEWFTSGPRQRLQPGGSIVVVMTRWGKRDLTGQVLKAEMQRGGEEWDVMEFPAILPSGNPLWPEFWSFEELEALRNELPNSKWQAQYQQSPTSDTSAIIKREWWKIWEEEDPPHCDYTLMSWDTAFEKSNRADYSAMTLWGVFDYPDDTGVMQSNLILLNAFRDRMEFPELKKCAIEQWKDWSPDSVIIEKKASGAPLIYELRAMGIPVQEYTPVRGNDKISRLNSVSDLFASGRVWAPGSRWADEVIDEVASFPAGEHDDYVDACSLALMRFRKGGFIRTLLDEEDEPPSFRRKIESYY